MELSEYTDEQIRDLIVDRLTNPGKYWIPNGAQWNFIKLFGGYRGFEVNQNTWVEAKTVYNFVSCFVAANGVGKTDVIAMIARTMLGFHDNPYFRDENGDLYPFYKYPPAGGIGRIISNPTNLTVNIIPALERLLPQGAYRKERRNNSPWYNYWEGPNGRYFDILSTEQDVDKFAGATRSWIVVDEPEDEPARFLESTARLRRGGQIGLFLTPLNSAAWVHDLVLGNTNWDVGAVYARIWINSTDPKEGIRGILRPEDIDRMIAGWSEEEYKARALGQFMHLQGLIYPMFNRKIHVVDPREIPDEGTIYCAMDPHDERPPFIGWFKACPNGRIYMIREYPEVQISYIGKKHDRERRLYYQDIKHDNLTIEDYAEIIRGIEDEIGESTRRVMDARFGNSRYPNSGLRLFEEYNKLGVPFGLAGVDPRVERGHAKVKALLRHSNVTGEDPNKPVVLPRLYISSKCQNTIRAFEFYAYDPNAPTGKPRPMERYKDPMDVVRMIADMDFKYIDPDFTEKWNELMSEASTCSLRN